MTVSSRISPVDRLGSRALIVFAITLFVGAILGVAIESLTPSKSPEDPEIRRRMPIYVAAAIAETKSGPVLRDNYGETFIEFRYGTFSEPSSLPVNTRRWTVRLLTFRNPWRRVGTGVEEHPGAWRVQFMEYLRSRGYSEEELMLISQPDYCCVTTNWFAAVMNGICLVGPIGVGVGVVIVTRSIRNRARVARGACPCCNYVLHGDFAAGCPECGWNR